MITKTLAQNQYRISDEDLDELQCWERPNPHNPRRPMLLFREQDVESKTLDRHGGPDGFLNYLRKLYKTHTTSKRAKKPFNEPAYYCVTSASTSTPGSTSGPSTYDPHVGRSAILRYIKARLAPWLWKRCNAVLHRIDEIDEQQ